MALVHILVCHVLINFENALFVSRFLDFTSAVRYEQVDLDTCLLSERSQLALHGEDGKLPPEPHPLPSPVRGVFIHYTSEIQSENKSVAQRKFKWGPRCKGAGKADWAYWSSDTKGGGWCHPSLGARDAEGVSLLVDTEAQRRHTLPGRPLGAGREGETLLLLPSTHLGLSQHCLPLAEPAGSPFGKVLGSSL